MPWLWSPRDCDRGGLFGKDHFQLLLDWDQMQEKLEKLIALMEIEVRRRCEEFILQHLLCLGSGAPELVMGKEQKQKQEIAW